MIQSQILKQNKNIFQCIGELLTAQEFKQAQSQFFEDNAHNFNQEDENKHIYLDIFNEYQHIIDKSIESKLLQEYTDIEVKDFFCDFEKNYKLYEDQEVIDNLFAFTDFATFKKLMLTYNLTDNKYNKLDKNLNIRSEQLQFQMFDSYLNFQNIKWKLIQKSKDQYQPTLYTTPYKDTGINLCYSTYEFKNISSKSIIKQAVVPDIEKWKTMKECKDVQLIGNLKENHNKMYVRIKVPLLTEREYVLYIGYKRITDTLVKVVCQSTEDAQYPLNNKFIRAEVYRDQWIESIPGTNNTKITSIEYSNMKGCDLLADQEFKQAQAEFFEKNAHHFDNEYENIFKEYSHILDQSINSKLIEKFSESEIQSFFTDFEANYKNYEDQDIIDNLFSFSDFEAFKKLMLTYNLKEDLQKDELNQEIPNGDDVEININMFDQYLNSDKKKWKQIQKPKDEYNPTIYTTPCQDTGLVICYCEYTFKDISIESVLEKIINPDLEKYGQMKSTLEAKWVGQKKENDNQLYMKIKIPMLSEREYLMFCGYRKTSETELKAFCHSVENPDFPIKKDIIRAELHREVWLDIVPGTNNTRIRSIEYSNMKGYIPKMSINMMIAKYATEEIGKFYLDCKEEEEKRRKIKK